MKYFIRLLCIFVLPTCLAQTVFAQSSLLINPDSTFGTNGSVALSAPPNAGNYYQTGSGMAIQPDGKFLIGGGTGNAGFTPYVARYFSNGALDTTFGSGGFAYLHSYGDGLVCKITCITLLANGKILVSGVHDSIALTSYIARLNPNGTVDSTFGTFGYTNVANVNSPTLLVLSDGSIVLGYKPSSGNYTLMKTDNAGVINTQFGTSGFLTVNQLAGVSSILLCQSDEILVAGSISNGNIGFVRFLSNGSVDNSYGQNGLATFANQSFTNVGLGPIILQPDNSIIVSGPRGSNNFPSAIHVLPNGTFDTNYGNAGLSTIFASASFPGFPTSGISTMNQENLFAGYYTFGSINTSYFSFLSALNVNGVNDSLSISQILGFIPFSVVQFGTNQLFVAGNNPSAGISLYKYTISASPLIIQSFSVQKQPDSTALLNWSTASEHNVSHYEIRKSADSINWQTIAIVAAVGNSNGQSNYSYIDSFPDNGGNYYRIKMVGDNGAYTYSSRILGVNFSLPTSGCAAPVPYVYQRIDTSVTIKFNSGGGNALYYQYAFIPIINSNDIFDTVPSLGISLFTSADTIARITGLNASTSYLVSMRARCSNYGYTPWAAVTFRTLCDTAALPYTENFNYSTFPCFVNGPWTFGGGIQLYPNNGQQQSGWAFTKRFYMSAGTTYRVYFKYGSTGSQNTSIALQMAAYQDTNSFVGPVLINVPVNFQSVDTFALFTPSVSGFYCAGFYSTTNSATGIVGIPQVQVLQNPASPSCTSNIFPVANAIQSNCNSFQFTWHSIPNAGSYILHYTSSKFKFSATAPTFGPDTTFSNFNFCGNPGDTIRWYIAPRVYGENATGCATTATYFTMQNVSPPANDFCSNAQTLTVTKGFCSNPIKGSLLGATFSNPSDTVSICLPPMSMPPGSDTADVWYKLIIPPTGNTVVQVSRYNQGSMTSSIIRAFSGSCGSLIPIGCSFDSGQYYYNSIEPYRERLYLTNRTPGETIFIRVSSSFYQGDLFTIGAFDTTSSQSPAIVSNFNTCTAAMSVVMDSLTGNLYMWNPLLTANGQIMGEVNPNGLSMGTVNASVYLNNGPLRVSNGIPYLDRNIQITPGNFTNPNSMNSGIRLYTTQAEISRYNTATGDMSISDFNVWDNEDNCGSPISSSGNNLGNIIDNGSYQGSNYYLTTQTSSFSSFYFYKGSSALPLRILSFTAQQCNDYSICLYWVTANEINVKNIVVERSSDAINFSPLTVVDALGGINNNNYSAVDKQPLNANGFNYYRIKSVDLDGNYIYSQIVKVNLQGQNLQNIEIAPNPANSYINIHSAQEIKRIDFLTGEGQVIKTLTNQGTSSTISISMFASGLYYLRIETSSGVVVKKISIVR